MIRVFYGDTAFELHPGESLLDGLLRQGVAIPHGCKTGSCQRCLLKCREGLIPAESQKGLKKAHQLNDYFLACQCVPQGEMQVAPPNVTGEQLKATIKELKLLAPEIMEVTLAPHREISYRAGQFIRLYHPTGPARNYSLASVPSLDVDLILHVRKHANGTLSSWIHHDLHVGEDVTISDALGDCFYISEYAHQPLLLIGTDTGLAPLFGILRDALQQGHQAPIHLFHEAKDLDGLYLLDELNLIAKSYPNVSYTACVSDSNAKPPSGIRSGRASDIALASHPDLKGWLVYLCGHPDMVRWTQMQTFLANAALSDIHMDPFETQL